MKTKLPKQTTTVNLLPLFVARGLPEPVPEYRFVPGRKMAFDYAFIEQLPELGGVIRVALEIDGGIYGRGKPCPVCKRRPVGAHSSIKDLKRDQEKACEAAILGWCVLHVRPEQVKSGEAFSLVERALVARGWVKA